MMPPLIRIAHSRWNELPEDELLANGYAILTRSTAAGVDAFVKQGRSLCLFFQGHPEYDARALLREYRRDLGRFLRHERETCRSPPHGYFAERAKPLLDDFQQRALADRRDGLMEHFPLVALNECILAAPRSPARSFCPPADARSLSAVATAQAGESRAISATPSRQRMPRSCHSCSRRRCSTRWEPRRGMARTAARCCWRCRWCRCQWECSQCLRSPRWADDRPGRSR